MTDLHKPRYRTIVKREATEEDIKTWLRTVPGFCEGLTTDMEGHKSKLYDYQIEHMLNQCGFRHVDKGRQVGISYILAMEALAKCHLKNIQTSIFISYNQEEANEKIRYAEALYSTIPEEYRKKLVVSNKQSMEFEHDGMKSRILSFAQRQPRGKGHNTDVNLDEFAHMMDAKVIYLASIPVVSRGSGVLTLASTPLGKDSMHYLVGTNRADYPMFSRMQIFWWDCPDLCRDVEGARKEAPFMDTVERVQKFGTQRLIDIMGAAETLEDFKQEYEMYYADELVSFFPFDLIKRCVFQADEELEELEDNIDPEEIASTFDEANNIMTFYKEHKLSWHYNCTELSSSDTDDETYQKAKHAIDSLLLSIRAGDFGHHLIAGMDIGRNIDNSEICIMEQIELGELNLHKELFTLEMDSISFPMQKIILRYLLNTIYLEKLIIDKTGMGTDFCEDLEAEFSNVEGLTFTNESKAKMARNFRFRLEDKTIAIYNDGEAIKQIHSIKKKITESSNIKFGAPKGKKHHGDKFWAKAMASCAGDFYDRASAIRSGEIRIGNSRPMADMSSQIIMRESAQPSSPIIRVSDGNSVSSDPLGLLFNDTEYYF